MAGIATLFQRQLRIGSRRHREPKKGQTHPGQYNTLQLHLPHGRSLYEWTSRIFVFIIKYATQYAYRITTRPRSPGLRAGLKVKLQICVNCLE
jgi:hypothetical protein